MRSMVFQPFSALVNAKAHNDDNTDPKQKAAAYFQLDRMVLLNRLQYILSAALLIIFQSASSFKNLSFSAGETVEHGTAKNSGKDCHSFAFIPGLSRWHTPSHPHSG